MELQEIMKLLSVVWDKIVMLIAILLIIKGDHKKAKDLINLENKKKSKSERKAEKLDGTYNKYAEKALSAKDKANKIREKEYKKDE